MKAQKRTSVQLRVKIKSLAEEAKIIRLEKRRAKAAKRTSLVNSLQDHKRNVVRPEARATHLAYGFLRGTSYSAMEGSAKTNPDWNRVHSMAKRYGRNYSLRVEDLKAWASEDKKEQLVA